MQAKVCPKCKVENRATNAACSNCYASLEAVAVTESSGLPPVRAQAVPAAPKPPRAPAGAPARTQQMPAPQQTQMGTMSPPPGMPSAPAHYQMTGPVKRSSSAWIIVLVLVLSLGFIGTMAYVVTTRLGVFKSAVMPTEAPDQVVVKFLAAKRTHALTNVEPFLSQDSLDLINKSFSSKQARSAGIDREEVARMFFWDVPPTPEDLSKTIVKAVVIKGDEMEKIDHGRAAVVHVTLEFNEPAEPAPPLAAPLQPGVPTQAAPAQTSVRLLHEGPTMNIFKPEYIYVLYAEDGRWKVDLTMSQKRTSDRLLGKLLGDK